MQQINNLAARMAKHQTQIKTATDKVIASGWLILGAEVQQFEKAFAAYLGTQHCIGVANGTDAIELALKALGVVASDQVATVANAGMYTTIALLAIGAKPFFIDVDLDTHNTTLAEVKRAIAAGVKAVVVTHLYGCMVPEIAAIANYCSTQGIPLLEDCAQAHGAHLDGKKAGSFGNAASFSFYPTKNLGALGDGGAVITNDPSLFESVKSLRQYGWSKKYQVVLNGARNSRLDEMQAAILSTFLPLLDEANAKRREIATRYTHAITHPAIITPPASTSNATTYVAHLYVIRTAKRSNLKDYLYTKNILAEVHYPIPDYQQPIIKNYFATLQLENTEKLSQEILTLPCYPEMSAAAVDAVISAINSWQP